MSAAFRETVVCVLCEKSFTFARKCFDAKWESNRSVVEKLKTHLLEAHKFIISDIYEIANLSEYLAYWKKKLSEVGSKEEYCAVIVSNSKPSDQHESEEFFMLCPDILPEDKALRRKLHSKRLEQILEIQQQERKDETFSRQCLFCKKIFTGNMRLLISHLASDHNFSVGHPDNLVFVGELLDVIDEKMHRSLCLFCEKTFKDRETLKEHMRKKHHKRLNPENKEYDKYYVVNYLDSSSKKQDIADDEEVDENDTWEDWKEEQTENVICLFCDNEFADGSLFVEHMKDIHLFDWNAIKNIKFYEKVKFINFVRKSVENKTCIHCQREFEKSEDLLTHIREENEKCSLPDKSLWDFPELYFPVYENDIALIILQDGEEEEEEVEEDNDYTVPVIPE